jgi:F0F1-type ATP synthase delta subunit
MKLKLPEDISTPQDFKSVILDTQKYAHWYAQNSVKQQLPSVKADEPPVISESTINLIKQLVGEKTLNKNSLDELIANLKSLEASLPRITITLAAMPTSSIKKTLVSWCRENIASDILVDLRFNSTLLGGMVVRYRSHIYDWSFRREILAARERFPEVLRRV